MMTLDEAIRSLQANPEHSRLIKDAYLEPDTRVSAARFAASAEFAEVMKLTGQRVRGGRVLDLGAGTGIASFAFARAGAAEVIAVEPDPSDVVGRGAMSRVIEGLNVRVIDTIGERLPVPDGDIDLVYVRQVLHHIQDLPQAMRECARVLKPGGLLLATREHVVTDEADLQAFLKIHPVHQLAGGENAYRLDQYVTAIQGAGLRLERVFGTFDSILNAYPVAESADAVERIPRDRLVRRFGVAGRVLALFPFVRKRVKQRLERNQPGRIYSFLAEKL